MNLEMNLFPPSQRDQGNPSLCGSIPSLTSCLMAHQEVLWSQLILPSGYSLLPLRDKLDHHMFKQASLIWIHKHLWWMMELQHASPMTTMTLLGPQDNLKKISGINGQSEATHRGAVRWLIEDHKGMTHEGNKGSTLKRSTSGEHDSMCMKDNRNMEYTIQRLMHQLFHGKHSESS